MFCPASTVQCGRRQSGQYNGCVHGSLSCGSQRDQKMRRFGSFDRGINGRGLSARGMSTQDDRAAVWPPKELMTAEEHFAADRGANSVVTWMENEVVPRLLRLDEKLDTLVAGSMVRGGSTGSRQGYLSPDLSPMPHGEYKESSWRLRAEATREVQGERSRPLATDEFRLTGRQNELKLPLPGGDLVAVKSDVQGGDDGPNSGSSSTTCPKNLGVQHRVHEAFEPPEAKEEVERDEEEEEEKLPPEEEEKLPPRQFVPDRTAGSCGSNAAQEEANEVYQSVPPRGRQSLLSDSAAEILQKRTGNSAKLFKAVRSASSIGSWHEIKSTTCRIQEILWAFLDDPESSKAARWYMIGMMVFTMMSVGVAILQSIDPPILEFPAAAIVEVTIEGIFLLELVTRFAVCPNKLTFFMDWHNIIDILVVTPLILRSAVGFELPSGENDNMLDLDRNALIGLVPVFRLMKTIRRFERFRLLMIALEACGEALPICLFPLMMITLVFGALIFMVEPRENIGSLGKAMWLTIVTMTTVGYGDTTPQTAAGSCIVATLVITSVLYMAMPLGIIGQAFQQVWEERDKVLLMGRTKDRLRQWAYQAEDIPVLFQWFDRDGDGSLNEREFLEMIHEMRLGLSRRRALDLFHSFDEDGSASVEDREFVKALFPGSYHKIFGEMEEEFSARKSNCSKG